MRRLSTLAARRVLLVNARRVATAGVIAAVYAALTFLVIEFGGQLAWGPLQFRPSEAVVVVAAPRPRPSSLLTRGSTPTP
jgi:hypothetical protein